jgi:hypothetical protein
MNLKSILPHALAIVIFFLLTVVLYHPYFFDGQGLNQHDILQSQGANHQLQDFRENTGEEALWMPTMFSGMPAYLNGVQFSGELLTYGYAIMRLGLPHPVSITFVAFVGFYVLLLAFRVRPWLAIAGAIVFGLNGFNIISISAGHNAKIAAVALMPWVLAGIRLAFTDKRWIGFGLTALALGIQIQMNHPQITYYLLLVVLIYGLVELIQAVKSKTLPSFVGSVAGLTVAALLALGANAGKLYHIYEYGKFSIRGKSEIKVDAGNADGLDHEYAFRYSNGITEPMVMFYPNIFGGSSSQKLSVKSNTAEALMSQGGYSRLQAEQTVQAIPTYWGDQPLTAPYYAGSMLLFLFVIGLMTLPKHLKIWLISAGLLGIMMSWGKNFAAFNDLLFEYLPMYNKFRSVTFTIIMPILAINILAFVGIEQWLNNDKPTQWKQLKWGVIIAGGASVFLLLISGMISYRGAVDAQLREWLIGAIREDRKSLFRVDVIRALIFTLIAAGILWSLHKDKVKVNTGLILLTVIALLDVLILSKRFLYKDNFSDDPSKAYFQATPADQAILASAKPGDRVLNLQNPWNDARTSYHHESIGGYHGAKMRRYQDLIDRYLYTEHQQAIESLQAGSRDFSGLHVLNMLNARFMLAGAQKEAALVNANSFGPAWIVSSVKSVNSPDEEIEALANTDLKSTAVVDGSKFGSVQSNGSGTIQLISKTPNKLIYTADITGGTALAVCSEIYYPHGWRAYMDGKEIDIIRANYILRAINLPEGKHEIAFEFTPESYGKMNHITMICSILILIGFVGTVVMQAKKSGNGIS